MEYLREFKVTFYSDSNKDTCTKEFNLEDYDTTEEMIEDIESLLKMIKNRGVLESF